jgi:hypothetical protein
MDLATHLTDGASCHWQPAGGYRLSAVGYQEFTAGTVSGPIAMATSTPKNS